jgi:hypothetical protein
VFDDAGGNGSDVGFNNLTVASPVPEPGTLALICVGGALSLFGSVRRNKTMFRPRK